MSISLGKGLLIAAGIGAVGLGGYMLLKGHGDTPADGATDPAAAGGDGPPTGTTTAPTAGSALTPGASTGGANPFAGAGGTAASSGPVTGTTTGTSATTAAQGQQVGPYTVMSDPQTGMSLVLETATQQPVGVLDEQGNMIPVTVDAQGKLQIARQPSTADALGTNPGTGMGTTSGYASQSSASVGATTHPGVATGTSATLAPSAGSSGAGSGYAQVARSLFANAENPRVGAASSDAMNGATSVAPSAGSQAGSVTASGSGGVQSRQVGEFTLLDDGSGVTVVIETATQQPVGMMDAAGNLTPISVDANGNIQVTGATQPMGSGGTTGATTTAGTMPSTGTVPTGTSGAASAFGAGY